jgi:predicted O-methyltransferase YrrM
LAASELCQRPNKQDTFEVKIMKNFIIFLLRLTRVLPLFKQSLISHYGNRSKIITLRLDDIVGFSKNNTAVKDYGFTQGNGGISPYESYVICLLVRHFQPNTIFEFGTFEGDTTYLMASSSSTSTKIFTISLTPEQYRNTRYGVGIREKKYIASEDRTGIRFRNTKYADQIQLILADSGKYDYRKLDRQIDFCFVDGSHTYDYVRNDTEAALLMLADNGIIVWHDYETALGVTRYLSKLSQNMDLARIESTSLIVKLPAGR